VVRLRGGGNADWLRGAEGKEDSAVESASFFPTAPHVEGDIFERHGIVDRKEKHAGREESDSFDASFEPFRRDVSQDGPEAEKTRQDARAAFDRLVGAAGFDPEDPLQVDADEALEPAPEETAGAGQERPSSPFQESLQALVTHIHTGDAAAMRTCVPIPALGRHRNASSLAAVSILYPEESSHDSSAPSSRQSAAPPLLSAPASRALGAAGCWRSPPQHPTGVHPPRS
jgi:hypothetical protein